MKTAALVPLAPFSLASLAPEKSTDISEPPLINSPLHERYELTLRRVLSGALPAYTEEFLLADVRPVPERRFTEYSGDLSGRYIGALATAAQVFGTKFSGLDALVNKAIALEKPEGYFGITFHFDRPTDQDLDLLWGNGRLLVGLIEYYRLKPSPAVLEACRRLGDFLVRVGPLMLSKETRDAFGAQHFASSYICWMQQTEGLANLYMVTHDERYRKLAEQIAAVIERRPSDHVHGYLASLRGVVDLYQATKDARLLRQCEAAWQDVAQSEDLLVTGGVPEGWSPNGHRTEGCAEADWVRLSLSLWKATVRTRYLAMAERTVFNDFAFNQFATGDFGHRLYSETGLPANGSARAWWCCTLHGLRCFPDIYRSAFRSQDGAVNFDLPVDGRMENAILSVSATSSLAHDGTVKITIGSAGEAPTSLRIRKPEWAENLNLQLNGIAIQATVDSGYLEVHRRWQSGDVLTVQYGMQLRSEPSGNARIAYSYGPWLLGAPESDNPFYFNELTSDNRMLEVTEKSSSPADQPVRPFAVPIAAKTFRYAPAEFPDQTSTVRLRAIAEQSGQSTTAWELRFRTANS
ncbi:MAG: beta-L-arabinofuranosidase domain-containing protein [Terracidiphilus sp.]